MRVEVKIPGGVESYCIDERGDKRVASDALWMETFLCGVLRAYAYADDGGGESIKKIIGVRRFDPITSTEMEHKFLDAAERLFFKGLPCPHVAEKREREITVYRTAARIRARGAGTKHRVEPSDHWSDQLYTYHRPVHVRH